MPVKGTKPALLSDARIPGYFLLVRRNLGRGSSLVSELHRRAAGATRIECMDEAEAVERDLNGGMTFHEAERYRIEQAREKRDKETTAELKRGAYFVTVLTTHQASQIPDFPSWSKRTKVKKSAAAIC